MAYCFKHGPLTQPLKTIVGLNDWEERIADIRELESQLYRKISQHGNREIVQQLRIQRRDLLRREREERRKTQSKLTGQFKTTSYEERMTFNPDRIPGTCEWFQRHELFKKWLREPSGLLLVSADPGCGKSVLARYLVEQVLPLEQPDATICYFFFKDTPEQRGLDSALCAILHQLFSDNADVADYCADAVQAQGNNLLSNAKALGTILEMALRHPIVGPFVCVLDALDECDASRLGVLIQLLKQMIPTLSGTNSQERPIKFLATTRGYPEILDMFFPFKSGYIHLSGDKTEEKRQIQKEITLVMDDRLATLSERRRLSQGRRGEIWEALQNVDPEQRTYLWVSLVFQVLEANFDDTSQTWSSLIRDTPATVYEAYEKLLQRVKPRDSARVRILFHLIIAAMRPLTLREMNIAIHIRDRGDEVRSEEDMKLGSDASFRDWLIHTCGFFVTEYDGKVFLIHQTAKEFLMTPDQHRQMAAGQWQGSIVSHETHKRMAESCVAYLAMPFFSTDDFQKVFVHSYFDDDVEVDGEPMSHGTRWGWTLEKARPAKDGRDTFFQYSISQWLGHFDYFNDEELAAEAGSRFHGWYLSLFGYSPPLHNPVLVGSLLSTQAVSHGRSGGHDLLPEDARTLEPTGIAAISIAALLGHRYLLAYLLEVDAGALSSMANCDEIAAVGESRAEMSLGDYRQLERRPPVNVLHQAIFLAASQTRWGCLDIILAAYPTLVRSVRDNVGRTPLHVAVEMRTPGAVEGLVSRAFDVNARDALGRTPLDRLLGLAMERTSTPIFRYLPATAMHSAATLGDLRLLISKGATCNASLATPLMVAAAIEEPPRPLSHVSPTPQSPVEEYLRTQYQYQQLNGGLGRAFENSTMKFLMDRGARINQATSGNGTALHQAAKCLQFWNVAFLIASGADPNSTGFMGKKRTPLHALMSGSNYLEDSGPLEGFLEGRAIATLDVLAEAGTSINAVDEDGVSPLGVAIMSSRQGMVAMLRLLAERGANTNTIADSDWYLDRDGNSIPAPCLHQIIRNATGYHKGNYKSGAYGPALTILCKEGRGDIDYPDGDGDTALHLASHDGQLELARVLLENGADLEVRNKYGETPLLLACGGQWCSADVVRLLLENGADVHARDKQGRSAMQVANVRVRDSQVGLRRFSPILPPRTWEHIQGQTFEAVREELRKYGADESGGGDEAQPADSEDESEDESERIESEDESKFIESEDESDFIESQDEDSISEF